MKKSFIITIDTEGDNLWRWKYGDSITSHNAEYLERFQNLCETFGFKPVYLTNYEMAIDKHFVELAKRSLKKGTCEIGMHLHAVNNPPIGNNPNVDFPSNFPYLIEYSDEIMEKKIEYQTKLLEDTFEKKIISHRAGRWAMDKRYERLLIKYGYKIDCSVTPGIDWSDTKGISKGSKGSDYTRCPSKPYFLDDNKRLLEIPVSIRHIRKGFIKRIGIVETLRWVKHSTLGQDFWLRPTGYNLNEMKYLLRKLYESDDDYIMFMLHSSELMPGGSPTFSTIESIEKLYDDILKVFKEASAYYEGKTLQEYALKNKLIDYACIE